MASAMEDLEGGIVSGSWTKVVRAYKRISGKSLEAPAAKVDLSTPPLHDMALRAAVEFYADSKNWVADVTDPFSPKPAPVARDRGSIARNALQGDVSAFSETEDEAEPEEGEASPPPPLLVKMPSNTGKPAKQADPFAVVHGQPKGDGENGKYCRKEPFRAPQGNDFKVSKSLESGELKSSKWINENMQVRERRPPVVLEKVTTTCPSCGKRHQVEPFEAKSIEDSEAPREVMCSACVAKLRRR